jgi:hypothetical protein
VFWRQQFDLFYVTDGKQVFKRRLKVRGFAPWAAPLAVPGQGAGKAPEPFLGEGKFLAQALSGGGISPLELF